MGGSWTLGCAVAALALLAGACARKDRVAPCAPGEGLVSAYAALETPLQVPVASTPAGDAADPCGPMRRLNDASPLAPSEE
jgi:hypothetical protein